MAEYRRRGTPWDEFSQKVDRLVRESGGSTLDPWSLAIVPPGSGPLELDPRFIGLAAHAAHLLVRKIYEIELEFSSALDKPRKITLELADVRSSKSENLNLLYPRVLFPAARVR